MAGLFSLDDVRNRPHQSGFSLENKRAFTAKCGELLPVYWTLTMPGDKFKLRNQWFTRTQPVQTSAYTRIREYYDYFFVPLRQIWKQGPQAVMQLKDNATAAQSSVAAADIGTVLPCASLSEIYEALTATTSSPVFADTNNALGYRRGDLAVKLLRYLGYGNFMKPGYETNYGTKNTKEDYDQTYFSNVFVNLLPLFAYQKIYNDVYRDSQWETSTPYTFNVDYWSGSGSLGTALKNQMQNWATLGRTVFDLGYCNWNKDIFTGVRPTSQFGDVAVVNISDSGSGATQKVTLTGGIQNFAGHLRFETPTSGSGGDYQPLRLKSKSQNDDTLYDMGPIRAEGVDANYYVRAYPGSQNLDVSGAFSIPLENADGQVVFDNTAAQTKTWQDAILQSEAATQVLEFNILALRQAEALQKWKEITLSGDMTYRDQVEKHFGVRLPDVLSDMVKYIGGFSGQIDISEVVNTSLPQTGDPSTDAAFGANIKGKGVGIGNGRELDFTADETGILMCVYHSVPLLEYDLSGQDGQLLVTSVEDLPIPEFDNLGMQEIPLVSLINSPYSGSEPAFSYLGYAPRYAFWKTAIDRVCGAFSTTLRDWVAPVDDAFLRPFVELTASSSFPLTYNFFKVNPALLNNIFGIEADGTWDTDQFLVNCQFDIKVVRKLSVTGMPY